MLDPCYTPFRDCYKAIPWSAFEKSSPQLLPATAAKNRKKYTSLQRHKWNNDAVEVLHDWFKMINWHMFQDATDRNISGYTDSVFGYISKCTDDVVPMTTTVQMIIRNPGSTGRLTINSKHGFLP